MVDEKALKKAIGLADSCELLASATAFPDRALADALSDGRAMADARSCLEDCGVAPDEVSRVCEPWESLAGQDPAAILADLRRAHSLLFVRQGNGVAVWPYESAYLHAEADRGGEPVLFRSAVTLDVERMMREAGALPQDSRVEPCDSVWSEFAFLSSVLAGEAAALHAGDEEASVLSRERFAAFVEAHARRWLPGFFDAVARELPSIAESDGVANRFYRGLCLYGSCVMGIVGDAG